MASQVQRNHKKEFMGWIYLILIMFLFPILFFTCVYLPMWMGWAQRFP